MTRSGSVWFHRGDHPRAGRPGAHGQVFHRPRRRLCAVGLLPCHEQVPQVNRGMESWSLDEFHSGRARSEDRRRLANYPDEPVANWPRLHAAKKRRSKKLAGSRLVHGERGNKPVVKYGGQRLERLLPAKVATLNSSSAPRRQIPQRRWRFSKIAIATSL